MNELTRVLDRLVAGAPVAKASWSDVLERESKIGRSRRRRRLALAIAAAAVLTIAGTAVAVGVDLLRQQERFHSTPDHERRLGPLVEIASGDQWALLAWKSASGRICLDYAVPGNSPYRCGFRVPGAMPADDPSRSGLPFRVVDGNSAGGANLVGGDGNTAILGVTTESVAAVEVELADGRILAAPLHDAPPKLDAEGLRFFIVRVRFPAELDFGRADPVRAYNAYDRHGRLIERVVSE